ncbi:MAG: hypothetical protein ABWX67_02360 [Allosphingosinicella sp.]
MLLAALLAAAAPQTCTLEEAQPATVREMAAAPDKWFDRCVRLEGFTTGNTFYQDIAATYRYGASDEEDRPNDGWLGLYFREDGGEPRRPTRVSVAGRVHDCARDYEAAAAQSNPGELIMSVGYCHYRGGLVLLDVVVRYGKAAAMPRATGEKARLAFGDLMTSTEAGAPPSEALRPLRRFVAAVRTGDAAAAAGLADGYNRTIRKDPNSLALWRSFLTTDGPFAFLRTAPGLEPAFFRNRQSREDVENGSTPDWFACFCATADCAAVWPISVKDAAADADQAYACVRLYRDFTGHKPWAIGIDTRKHRGFNEPY